MFRSYSLAGCSVFWSKPRLSFLQVKLLPGNNWVVLLNVVLSEVRTDSHGGVDKNRNMLQEPTVKFYNLQCYCPDIRRGNCIPDCEAHFSVYPKWRSTAGPVTQLQWNPAWGLSTLSTTSKNSSVFYLFSSSFALMFICWSYSVQWDLNVITETTELLVSCGSRVQMAYCF